MKITHTSGKIEVSKSIRRQLKTAVGKIRKLQKNSKTSTHHQPAPAYIIPDWKGGYYSSGIKSRYSGLHAFIDGRMYKIAEPIIPKTGDEITALHRREGIVTEKSKGCDITLSFMESTGTLCCIAKRKAAFDIALDIRESYDSRIWGRNYRTYAKSGMTIVEFIKRTDSREDDSEGREEFRFYVAVAGLEMSYSIIQRWEEMNYPDDLRRGSGPFQRHVHVPLRIDAKAFCIATAKNEREALDNARKARASLEDLDAALYGKKRLTRKQEKEKASLLSDFGINPISDASIRGRKDLSVAYRSAVSSLIALTGDDGILAGYPWFFQYWTRDECISLKALMLIGRCRKARDILFRHLKSVLDDGRLPNRHPHAELGTADGIGWMFRRLDDLFKLSKEGKIEQGCTDAFMRKVAETQIERSVISLLKHHTGDDFASNSALETWMDTHWEDDSRSGKRIEIQALRLSQYRLAYDMTQREEYRNLEQNLRMKVRKHFWNGSWLADGLDDCTIRPNIFIAAYVYPNLLEKEEWKQCFDVSLKRLWLSWGGLSTIDKTHRLFTDTYTGESNKSYHRGDSWYWLNCLAAIVMARIDRQHYRKYIDRIVESSTSDILFSGFIGSPSEVSSAGVQTSDGCLSQAWSAAMYIELIEELYSVKK